MGSQRPVSPPSPALGIWRRAGKRISLGPECEGNEGCISGSGWGMRIGGQEGLYEWREGMERGGEDKWKGSRK